MKPFGDWKALQKSSLCQMPMMETAIINLGDHISVKTRNTSIPPKTFYLLLPDHPSPTHFLLALRKTLL